MILSNDLGWVFIKTRKTAGTSTEIALSRHCGPDDVITPIVAEDEELRASVGGLGPQNFAVPLRQLRLRDARLLARSRRPTYYNHVPAAVVRSRIGQRHWDRLFSFSIERHPWDRLVSLYHWEGNGQPFGTWLHTLPDWKLSNFPLYSFGDHVIVDRVLLYERGLPSQIDELFSELGLPAPGELPRAKSGSRPKGDYREMFTDETAEFVARRCRREIAMFGYKFDLTAPAPPTRS